MNTSKYLLSVLILLIINFNISAQVIISPSPILWYTLNEAVELNKKEKRPIIIDVYTDWCGWCKHMMKTTFSNKGIANYINNNYYAVRFNAESLDTIEYKGKKYFNRRIGRRPTHDLSNYLLDSKMSYPTIVYFDRDGKKTVIPGFKEAKDIEPVLIYFNENLQKHISLNEFIINYMFAFPYAFDKDHSIFKIDEKLRPDTLGKTNWYEINDFNYRFKKKPKPILLFMQTDWCVNCKVMEKISFRNTKLANYINDKFYLIKIDAASQDTIKFLGKTFFGNGKGNPHQLTKAIFPHNKQMPALAVFDKKGNLLTKANGYLTPIQLIPFVKYFYEKKYLTIKYQDYLKDFFK